MGARAVKTDPELWERVKAKVTAGDQGGAPGQWSARKAQRAVHDYKAAGGGYQGPKDAHNSLTEWSHENWATKSGAPSGETQERYLPERARARLSDAEYAATTEKKRADARAGRQYSRQPPAIAAKTAQAHAAGRENRVEPSRAALYAEAQRRRIAGRSRMTKAQLAQALGG